MTNTGTTSTKSWVPDTESFGARLALVRWKMGWNLKEASAECELSANSWSQWEEGAMPRNYPQAVMSISARTGVDLYWLMTGKGPEGQPSD
ncbi:MAG: helix-turn-helix domain-containing protein [Homoserinimonas sp.]